MPILFTLGFSNYIDATRVMAVANPSSAPIKRLIKQAEEKGMLIDLSSGHKVKVAVLLDTGHIIIAARQPETVVSRVNSLTGRPVQRIEEGKR